MSRPMWLIDDSKVKIPLPEGYHLGESPVHVYVLFGEGRMEDMEVVAAIRVSEDPNDYAVNAAIEREIDAHQHRVAH